MSWYLTISPSAGYAELVDTLHVTKFLASLPELQQNSPISFESRPGHPAVQIILARANDDGGYAADGSFIPQINVIELICPYSNDTVWYESLACRIADFLGWTAREEMEDRQVWPNLAPAPPAAD
jgi:hypothetical protein